MERSIKKYAAYVAFVGGLAWVVGGAAVAGIANTKHNLGSTGTGPNHTDGTAEICVFCHTPHGSDASASVPLWNKTLPAAGSFTTYDQLGTSSLDGAVEAVGSVSIACLSCHDGAQAMDSMINAPGSGNVAIGGIWTGSSIMPGTLNTFPNLGKDLQNDHPVGIQYAGGGCVAGANCDVSLVAADKDFKDAQWKLINANNVWWVDVASGKGNNGVTTLTGTADTREKMDMQLYTRGVTPQPYVECASCHDPHTENNTFLRVENDSSTVCLACHVK